MTLQRVLDAADLAERHPGLSEGVARALVEAAGVTLARHHSSPTRVVVRTENREFLVTLDWPAPSERAHRAWADHARATEWAAEAVAIVCFDAIHGLVVVDRAQRGARGDYYLGRPRDDFEHAALLEIAGLDDGAIESLLRRKVRQVEQYPDRLPALAVVVRFRDALVIIEQVRRSEE